GHEGHRPRHAAMGHGDTRDGGSGKRRAHARNDPYRDSRAAKRIPLLTTPSEEKRVAALEANHEVAGASGGDHRRIDVLLRRRSATRALAGIDEARARTA